MILMTRRLLEHGVPVALLNEEAQKEKLAVPPHVLLHYYFTRKPLITARLAIAGGLLGEHQSKHEFSKLIGIHKNLKSRAYIDSPEKLKEIIRMAYPDGVTLLDPFAGSGTIPFEALRLGINAVALDYNPVSYLVMKGTLEYPRVFRELLSSGESKLYHDVKQYAEKIIQKLDGELGRFFPDHDGTKVRCYIHAWAVKCPFCGRVTPLVAHWELDSKNKVGLKPIYRKGELSFKLVKGEKLQSGNVKREKRTCIYRDCTLPIPTQNIVDDISKHEREILLAVYLETGEFDLPNNEDRKAFENAKKYLKEKMSEIGPYIPSESMQKDVRSAKYLQYWYKLFNPRQLLIHSSIAKEIHEIVKELQKDDSEYAAAIGTYLSMILSKHLMYSSRAALWHRSRLIPAHVLTSRGISMMWSHPEVNPFVKTAGSLLNGMDNILRGLKFLIDGCAHNQERFDKEVNHSKIEIINESILSWRPNRKFPIIVTDPPYYDDVPYPEFMQFFQVWHSRTVGSLLNISPVPSTTEELSVGRDRDDAAFESRMLVAIKRLHDLLEDDGILVVFYAHKSIDGWKYVLESLRESGFIVTSTHTLRTESGAGTISKGKASIFHSLLLTARKRLDHRTTSIPELEEEVRGKMDQRYEDLVRLYGNDRINLMVAASGIVIETITSYAEIDSFTKNTADYALEMGQQFLIELFAKRALNIDFVDPKTMLYAWLRYSPQKLIPFSEFNQALKALGIDEEDIDDIIYKDKSNVRLLDFSERGVLEIDGAEPLMATSVIDAVQLILRGYLRGGISEAIPLIRTSPYGEENLLHTIEGLAKLASLRPEYEEGEICKKFLKDWGIVYESVPAQQMKLDEYLTEGDDENDK
jgi:adenine-specific DNA methylase